MPQKGLHIVVFPRQSGRVGQGDAGPVRALPQLACRQRHAPGPGLGGGGGQGRGVFQGLQHHAHGANARLVQQGVQQGGDPQAGAVPQGDHHGQGQGAPIHGQGEGDVAALRQDGDAALDAGAPVLIRPQRRALQVVDKPVAIRAEQRHGSSRLHQGLLQSLSLRARLAEAGGVTHHPAGAPGRQCAGHLHGELPAHAYEGGVRRRGQFIHRAIAGQPRHFLARGMDRVDGAGELHLLALSDHIVGFASAYGADGAGLEQARQRHGGRGAVALGVRRPGAATSRGL